MAISCRVHVAPVYVILLAHVCFMLHPSIITCLLTQLTQNYANLGIPGFAKLGFPDFRDSELFWTESLIGTN